MKNVIKLFFLLSIVFTACNTASDKLGLSEKDDPETQTKNIEDAIEESLFTEQDTITPIAIEHLLSHKDIKLFYQRRNWKPVWTSKNDIDSIAFDLLIEIDNAINYGYSPGLFHASQIRSLIEDRSNWSQKDRVLTEFMLTDAFMLFSSALKYGIIDKNSQKLNYKAFEKDEMSALLDSFFTVKKRTDFFGKVQNKNPRYVAFHKVYLQFLVKNGKDDTRIQIPNVKEDSLACYRNGFLALQNLGYLKKTNSNEQEGITALKNFQKDHGLEADGRIGKNTGVWLSKSVWDHLLILAANLEKSKWESFTDPEYVLLNVPAYKLRIIRNDSILAEHKVVVGTVKTQTPELSSKIIYLVTYPFWFVPYSISTKEILPNVRIDPNYLSKKNYSVLDRDRNPVDPSSISWKTLGPGNFPYTIRQDGGNTNSLGLIKFIFPNIHSVYLHDTPSKNLFGADIRAFSHGCMRLQNPLNFAAYLLDRETNSIQKDSLDTLINQKIRRQVNFSQPLPIHIRYHTVETDANGKVIFYTDIYKKDDEIIKGLFPDLGIK